MELQGCTERREQYNISGGSGTLRVQVPNTHILAPNLYYNYYDPKPKYPVIGYSDPYKKLSRHKAFWLGIA